MDQNRDYRRSSFQEDENRDQYNRSQRENEYNQQRGNQSNYGNQNFNRENDYRQGSGYGGDYNRNMNRGFENRGNERGNDWNDRNQDQGNYGGWNQNRWQGDDYSNYNRGGQFGNRNQDFGNRSQDFDRDRNWGNYGQQERYRGEDRSRNYGSDYGSYGSQNYRDRDRDRDRDWWDKTRDEVSSWFGDDDAERRRRMDRAGEHRGKGPKNYKRSSERIREDLNDRLSDDPFVDASEVDVQVNDCDVTLTGSVNSKQEKRRAEDIAESISGVKSVQNNLRVGQTTGQTSDPSSTMSTGTTGTMGKERSTSGTMKHEKAHHN